MDTIKATVYSTLNSISNVAVSQGSQAVVNSFPAITFNLSDNQNTVSVDGELLSQQAEIVVDIWAKSSTACSNTMSKAEAKLRTIGYVMTYAADIPDPDDSVFHISTRFIARI